MHIHKQRADKMDHSRGQTTSWSDLPSNLIRNISYRLTTRDQLVRFKRVCRRWNKHSPVLPVNNNLSYALPKTVPNSKHCNPLPFHSSTRCLLLQVSSIYLITPSQSQASQVTFKPWMIMVEESKPGILRLLHPLTAKRVNNFPPSLDMNRFRANELAHGYSFKHSDCIRKVVLCSSPSSTCLQALVLYREGVLGKLSVGLSESKAHDEKNNDDSEEEDEEEEAFGWNILKTREKGLCWFLYLDDIIEFKEKYCGVDRKGNLYELDIEAMKVVSNLVSKPIFVRITPAFRRKRLVVDPTSGELHVVVRECRTANVSFTVYKFNEHCNRWDVVEHLGRDRLVFVGVDHCFFAKATDFPGCKGNSIVFAANCFTQYKGIDAPDGSLFGNNDHVEMGVYRVGKGDNFRLLSSAYPEFSKLIWPPPMWFSPKSECKDEEPYSSGSSSEQHLDEGSSSSIKSLPHDHTEGILTDSTSASSSDKDKDEEILIDSSSSKPSKVSVSNGITSSDEDDEVQQKSSFNEQQNCDFEEQFSIPPLPITYEVHNDVGTPKMDYQKYGEGSGPELSKEKAYDAKSTPVTPAANLPAFSTIKFEGVEIKSELLPTLKTIWIKHGSLITKDTVHNKDMRASALESVAKLVITLQNTTGKNLTDSRADDIQSTLSDLQRVGLKVDWLVPAVEKASKLQKHKPVIESIQRLNKRKAQIDEEEKQFLARTTKVKQEIEEDMACLSARIPPPEIIDLDDCLGGELF